jgi:hypothetical protein
MHHRSPTAAGTVPTSIGGVLAELAEPALLDAAIAHPSGGHDAQLHIHGTPEAVSNVTASTAPAAAMRRVHCAVLPHGNRRVRTADGRCGRSRRPSRCGRRRHCRSRRLSRRWRRRCRTSAETAVPDEILEYPVVLGGVQSPSQVPLTARVPLSDPDAATRYPRDRSGSRFFRAVQQVRPYVIAHPRSTLTVPLRARAHARRPFAVRLCCRAAPPTSTVGIIRVCVCVYIPIYICVRISIFRPFVLLSCTPPASTAQDTRVRTEARCGGGAPVVASAAHSSCVEKPAPTAWVLKYATLLLS